MRLDLRTAIIVLGAVALGYVICLAMPVARAGGGQFPAVVDQLLVTDYIKFANGVRLEAAGDTLAISGPISISRINFPHIALYSSGNKIRCTGAFDAMSLYIEGKLIINQDWKLFNLDLLPNNVGGGGLDVGKLQGHPASDFVLKSELPQCPRRCPEVKQPPVK